MHSIATRWEKARSEAALKLTQRGGRRGDVCRAYIQGTNTQPESSKDLAVRALDKPSRTKKRAFTGYCQQQPSHPPF